MNKMSGRLEIRADDKFLRKLDGWRREQADLPTRSGALRQLADAALENECVLLSAGVLSKIDDWRVFNRIWSRASAIEFLLEIGEDTVVQDSRAWTKFAHFDAAALAELEAFLDDLDDEKLKHDTLKSINNILEKLPEYRVKQLQFMIDDDGEITITIDDPTNFVSDTLKEVREQILEIIVGSNVNVPEGLWRFGARSN